MNEIVKYKTDFYLSNSVCDLGAAQDFLEEDDMTQYLKADFPELAKDIILIKWNLVKEDRGNIELHTSREFTKEELDKISEWVVGQNADGLGESFEQRDFAYYDSNAESKRLGYQFATEEEEDEEYWVMCSFDWQSNKYEFERID